MLRFGKTSCLSGAPFVVVSECVCFCKAHTAPRTAEIGQLYRGQAVSQRCFSASFLVFRLVLSGASAGAPFVASPCAFFGDFYFALLHQSTLNYVRFTGMSLGFRI